MQSTREFLTQLFCSTVDKLYPSNLPLQQQDMLKTFLAGRSAPLLLAVGKAAEGMAAGIVHTVDNFHPLSFVTTVYAPVNTQKQLVPLRHIQAGHPLPNENSVLAAKQALEAVASVDEETPILLAISGGASSAWCLPAPGLSRDDVMMAWRMAMQLGLDIKTLNLVRRSLSSIKGGGLLRVASKNLFLNLAMLDVVDGRPQDLGSGPAVCGLGDDSEQWQKLAELTKYFSPQVQKLLQQASKKNNGPRAWHRPVQWQVLADPGTLRKTALQQLQQGPYRLKIDSTFQELQGPVETQAVKIADWLRQAVSGQVLVLSGECEMALPKKSGHGGRAQHLALSVMQKMRDCRRQWSLLSVASDGVDGNSVAAGALVDEKSRDKYSWAQCQAALEHASSGDLFAGHDEQIVSGATGTNLCDLLIAWAR